MQLYEGGIMKSQSPILLLLVSVSQLLGHGLGITTSIRRDKIRQPIEQLFQNPRREKLWVSSYDFHRNAIVNSRLKSAGESQSNCYFQISFDDNQHNDILCTPSQEFYDVNGRHWILALRLQVGTQLLSAEGMRTITSIKFLKKPLNVYALEVENTHNFFAGSYAIATHNMAIPWALTAGLGVSFGAGAAAGGTAGGCFGPITFIGGAALGGIIGIAIKTFIDSEQSKYKLHFDIDRIEDLHKTNILYEDKSDDAQAPGKPTENDGFVPKKNWDGKKVKHRRGYGWPDSKDNIWIPSGPNGHGGPHWDVQKPSGDYDNVVPGGKIRGQK